ncbi:hypothetical protein PMSD_18465 [Paenibacillus macquariensis subsp. defensor]|nr:hypothetical protein PMSD_18465 [Paenibacillus macquariensis subsp. defensor]
MKKISLLSILLSFVIILTACTDADIASNNLSKAADNFEVDRRIIFYNGITDTYLLTIEGRCSLGNQDDRSKQVTVTCKTGENAYKKHFLGLSDNVTYFAEQLEPVVASAYHYRVTFKPQSIVPDIDLRVSGE